MHIVLMGTRGLPPKYGGFETAVYEVGRRLATAGHRVTVYCRNPDQSLATYEGMDLVNLPCVRQRSLETLSHTALSTAHAIVRARPDVVLLFNAANAPFVPLLRMAGIPVALHVDGLESARGKWQGLGSAYYRQAERWGVRWSDAVISDAQAIASYLQEEYGCESDFIPYGADLVHSGCDRLEELGLETAGYHLVVARFEPENHVDVIVDGYSRSSATLPLVVVGAAPYSSSHTQEVHSLANDRVRFLGSVWDQELLDQLYVGSASYLHGHSVGGTNPSLLRAMGAGATVIAWDVVFNHEVTGGHAHFFAGPEDIARLLGVVETDLGKAEALGEDGRLHVGRTYRWDQVASDYEALALRLERGRRRSRA